MLHDLREMRNAYKLLIMKPKQSVAKCDHGKDLY